MPRSIYPLLVLIAMAPAVAGQTLYKYKDKNGQWRFTDRPQDHAKPVETKALNQDIIKPEVAVIRRNVAEGVSLVAINEFHCPIQLIVEFVGRSNISTDVPTTLNVTLAPKSSAPFYTVSPDDPAAESWFSFRYSYMLGAPDVDHAPVVPYRVPFAAGTEFTISQAFPRRVTHIDEASAHAIDIAMPEGTPVYASRDGLVVSIAYESYSGGTDPTRDLPKANLVRVMHEDGTLAVYAHLSWNSIRVRPGQRVKRGEYIADSGNTGFSSGPHLHFAVQRNAGFKMESLPVTFEGRAGETIVPRTGAILSSF